MIINQKSVALTVEADGVFGSKVWVYVSYALSIYHICRLISKKHNVSQQHV